MSALTFSCPRTGASIVTGIETDRASLARVQLISIKIRCDHCRQEHELPIWSGRLSDMPKFQPMACG